MGGSHHGQPIWADAACQTVSINDEQQLPGNLSPADWNLMLEIVAAVRQAIPDASSKPPGQV